MKVIKYLLGDVQIMNGFNTSMYPAVLVRDREDKKGQWMIWIGNSFVDSYPMILTNTTSATTYFTIKQAKAFYKKHLKHHTIIDGNIYQ